MTRKIIFGVVISAILIGGVYWFFHTKEARMPISEGINAIPVDAAIIFESKQSKNTWKKLSQTNIMWEELLGTEIISKINRQGTYFDSILQSAPEISQLLDEHSIYISLHSIGKNNFDLLYTYSLPNLTYKSSIEDYIKEKIHFIKVPLVTSEFEGEATNTIATNKTGHFYYAIVNGVLTMSVNQQLIQTSIHQIKSGISLNNDKNFNKVIRTAGKNVDANIYINYEKISELTAPLLFPSTEKTFSVLSNFADCSSWDISIKPNALMLSGFTSANDSSKRFLSLFNKQKPQETEVIKVIPSTVSTFLFLGMSDVKTYHTDYKNYLKTKNVFSEYEKFIKQINKQYETDIEDLMLSWMDNEMALIITEPENSDFLNNSYAIIRSNNIEDALNSLNELSANTIGEEKTDSSTYKGYSINKLNIENLLPNLLGHQFEKIKTNYFTSIDNYIVLQTLRML